MIWYGLALIVGVGVGSWGFWNLVRDYRGSDIDKPPQDDMTQIFRNGL